MASGSSLPVEGHHLKDISPRAFQHPADKAATAALGSIPYLDTVVRKLIELGYERALRQSYLGSAVRLGEDQLGDVWREHAIAYATLDMAEVPDLYLTQFPSPNAMAIGANHPIVVVQSELIALLDAGQRRAVFAHEAAHILSDHQLYRTALQILVLMTRSARLPLPLAPVRTALMEWGRATELSADRAAALVTRDPLVVCRTLMSLAAGAMVDELDLDVFMRQGLDYKEGGGGLEKLTRLMLDLGVTHPMPVKRTHELMDWVRSASTTASSGPASTSVAAIPSTRAPTAAKPSPSTPSGSGCLQGRRRVGQLGGPTARRLGSRHPRNGRGDRGTGGDGLSRSWARSGARSRGAPPAARSGARSSRHPGRASTRARRRQARPAPASPGAEAALQAIAPWAHPLGARHPLAVVGDRCPHELLVARQADDCLVGLGVAADVRQRLLDDAVDRALELGVQAPGAVVPVPAELDLGFHIQPVDRLGTAGQRLQGGRQPQVVKGRRAGAR